MHPPFRNRLPPYPKRSRELHTRGVDALFLLNQITSPLLGRIHNRPDGLAQFARRLGLEVDLFDSDPNTGGEKSADITNDKVYNIIRERVHAENMQSSSLRLHAVLSQSRGSSCPSR